MKDETRVISYSMWKVWNRLPFLFRTILAGFFVSSVGIGIWSIFVSSLKAPWFIFPMIPVLWGYLWFFSGNWGSKTRDIGKFNAFRSTTLSPQIWKPGIVAAILFVITVQASFVITFRLTVFPADKFMADYKILDKMPRWGAWAALILSSLVAAICEETGFRGYMQAPLEKKYGVRTAIGITSLIFVLIHLSHTWAWPIIPHIFFASVLLGILAYRTGTLIPGMIGHWILDIFDYSVWWTDLTGGFRMQTIFKTGIDLNFIAWCLIFAISLFGFFRILHGIKKVNQIR